MSTVSAEGLLDAERGPTAAGEQVDDQFRAERESALRHARALRA